MTNNPKSIYENTDFKGANKNTQHPKWLQTILNKTKSALTIKSFFLEGLEIDCWSESPEHISWLSKYLHPLVYTEKQQETIDHFKVGMFFSDDLIVEVAFFIDSGKMELEYVNSGKALNTRLVFSRFLIVDFDPISGVVCVTDLNARTITMVISCHTTQPPRQLGRCVRDLITGFLRNNDWQSFHAGSFQTNDGVFMVIGNQGAGKTSLILAMVYSGARYIANDRVFVKQINGKPYLLSFPMAPAVGLGTALQYPALKRYIANPILLSHPTGRLELERILSTPEHQWSELPDKIQPFPGELERDFNSKSSISGGEIKGVLFPTISKQTYLTIQPKEITIAEQIIEYNIFPWQIDRVMPPWRPFDYNLPLEDSVQPLVNRLLELPLVDFQYFADKSRMTEMKTYIRALSQYIKCH